MTTQPKTVAELREAILPHLLDLEALDELARRAEVNERMREAAKRVGRISVNTSWTEVDASLKALRDSLAAAPSQPKADEVDELRAKLEAASVTESSDRAKTWHENCSLFLMCLERVADAADARFKCLWPDLHKFVAPRAKLEAAQRDLAAARADQRAVAVKELKVLVERVKANAVSARWTMPGGGAAESMMVTTSQVKCMAEDRIAALTAPAAEPVSNTGWFEPNEHTKNVCAIRRKSDGYWWECSSAHGAGWNDKRIRQAWTLREARIEIEKHLKGEDVEIVQLMPEPSPAAEPEKPEPTLDVVRRLESKRDAIRASRDVGNEGLAYANGIDTAISYMRGHWSTRHADGCRCVECKPVPDTARAEGSTYGDTVLREYLDCISQHLAGADPETQFYKRNNALRELCRRALEGK